MDQYKLYDILNIIGDINRYITCPTDYLNNTSRLNFNQYVLFYNFINLLNLDFGYDHGEISEREAKISLV